MTLTEFLQHWKLTENPFKGEEARADDVFARLSGLPRPAILASDIPSRSGERESDAGVHHSDFEKIVGDLRRPAAAVVFGEKGSGKTAIRLQIARRIAAHNTVNTGAKLFYVGLDDLNIVTDRVHERVHGKTPLESLQKTRLADHLDAILHIMVPRVVDAVLETPSADPIDMPDARLARKKLDEQGRNDLLLLQTLYDRPAIAIDRTTRLRRRLRLWAPWGTVWGTFTLILLALILGAALVYHHYNGIQGLIPAIVVKEKWIDWSLAALGGLYILFALKHGVWDRLSLLRTSHRVRRQLRVVQRGDLSFARSLRQLSKEYRDSAHLPMSDSDEGRYSLLDRLRRVLRTFGYTGIMVVVDRVDEPTLVAGDPERMKAVIWPILSNKFLQQEGLGVKLLLPMELKHAVFRESSAFFQGARLDKQSFIEQLAWTGPTLYDLCETRIRACSELPETPPALLDFFEPDVTKNELMDSLERLHQPRDAFKFIYRCMTEHCASVTRSEPRWKIPRHIMQNVLKSESDRLAQMNRGIRPG